MRRVISILIKTGGSQDCFLSILSLPAEPVYILYPNDPLNRRIIVSLKKCDLPQKYWCKSVAIPEVFKEKL
jgi:hypothetical protein